MMNKIPQAADNILRQNHVGVLATVSSDGLPWATPLHFLYNGEQIAWFSPADCMHSHNARQQPNVSVALFSPDEQNGLHGVYITGVVQELQGVQQQELQLWLKCYGSLPSNLQQANTYRLPIGQVDAKKSTNGLWYFTHKSQ